MSEVFYRKWRPRRLDQVVGQQAVTQTLLNAVRLDRVAHAYLFCGHARDRQDQHRADHGQGG